MGEVKINGLTNNPLFGMGSTPGVSSKAKSEGKTTDAVLSTGETGIIQAQEAVVEKEKDTLSPAEIVAAEQAAEISNQPEVPKPPPPNSEILARLTDLLQLVSSPAFQKISQSGELLALRVILARTISQYKLNDMQNASSLGRLVLDLQLKIADLMQSIKEDEATESLMRSVSSGAQAFTFGLQIKQNVTNMGDATATVNKQEAENLTALNNLKTGGNGAVAVGAPGPANQPPAAPVLSKDQQKEVSQREEAATDFSMKKGEKISAEVNRADMQTKAMTDMITNIIQSGEAAGTGFNKSDIAKKEGEKGQLEAIAQNFKSQLDNFSQSWREAQQDGKEMAKTFDQAAETDRRAHSASLSG